MSAVDPEWFQTFFESDWLEVATRRDEEQTHAQVAFLIDKLCLEPGARVLDLACGHGRHALELAARGCAVTGVDISEPSLAIASEQAAQRRLDVELVRLDMRELAAEEEFDACFNVFSAFGYFASEEEDLQVLERVAHALVPGGRFLVETINPLWLARHFEPRSWSTREDGTVMIEERVLDAVAGRSIGVWTMIRADGSRSELRHSVRVYTAPELRRMAASVGLQPDGLWGGVDGSDYEMDSRRLVMRVRKGGDG